MPEPEDPVRRALYDHEAEFHHDDTHPGRRHRQIADWGGDDLFTRMPRRRSIHDGGSRSRRFEPAEPDARGASHRHGATPPGTPERSVRFARDPEGAGAGGSGRSVRDREGTGAGGSARLAQDPAAAGADAPGRFAPAAGKPAGPRDRRCRPADDWGLDLPSDPPTSPAGDAPTELRAEPGGAPNPRSGDPAWVLESGDHDRDAATRAPAPRGIPASQGAEETAEPHRPPHGAATGRRTVLIGRSASPVAETMSGHRHRPPRTVAERIGGQPERMVAWAFALGVLLILIAIATAHV